MKYISVAFYSFLYLIFAIYFINNRLVFDTVFGLYPLVYKIKILLILPEGLWTAITKPELLILIIASVLSGINLTLLLRKSFGLKQHKKLCLATLGNQILPFIGVTCSACSLLLVGLIGTLGSFVYAPLIIVTAISLVFTWKIKTIKPSGEFNQINNPK